RQDAHSADDDAHDGAVERPQVLERFLQLRQIHRHRVALFGRDDAHFAAPWGWMVAVRRMAGPARFTSSVIPSSTGAASRHMPRCMSEGRDDVSENLLATNAASVFAGEKTDHVSELVLPTSMARAIVSPSARPNARIMEP